MSLSAKRRLLLAKTEITYGVDPTPTGANAIVVSNLDVSPMEAETVERDLIRPYFGQAERLMTKRFSRVNFEVELAAHSAGIIGAAPAIDALMKACGFEGTQETLSVSEITRDGTTATATIGAHTYEVGNKVSISGAAEEDYNGTQTITAVDATTISFEVANSPTSPATGTIVMKSGYKYTPISTDIPSVAFYYNVDGVLHKCLGAYGTFSLDITVANIPKLKFEFTALNSSPADAAAATADFSNFSIPQVANTQNTTNFSLLGFSGALEQLTFALNNAVPYISLIGSEYVKLLDRKVSGTMSFEAPTIATKDFWSAAADQDTGACTITHGSEHGNKVAFNFPRVLLDSPKYKELNNVMMMTCGISIMPDEGDDEMEITFQ